MKLQFFTTSFETRGIITMKKKVSPLWCIILILALGVAMAQVALAEDSMRTASEDTGSRMALISYANYILPPKTVVNVTIANIGLNKRRCSDVEAEIRILSTIYDSQYRSDSSSQQSAQSKIALLQTQIVRLSPGQAELIEFNQSSTEKESVFFVTTTKPRFKRCLAHSPVALTIPSDGTFTYVPGTNETAFPAILDFALTGDDDF
jgi:hypothetical protein